MLKIVEEVRNRPDKTKLSISGIHAEKILAKSVCSPELVIHLNFEFYLDVNEEEYRKLYGEYTNTKYKDIVNFTNLETFVAYDLDLSSDVWKEFAQNSNHLREISFFSNGDLDSGYDNFCFNDVTKEEGLQAIFDIPTLDTVRFARLELNFFPKGPSNVRQIEFECMRDDEKKGVNYFENLCTHTNIENIIIDHSFVKIFHLQLEKLPKLKKLELTDEFVDINDLQSLKAILELKTLKFLKLEMWNYDGPTHIDFDFVGNIEDKLVEFELLKLGVDIEIEKMLKDC